MDFRVDAAARPADIARISPELALVDPELARRLRRRIPRKRLGHRPPLPALRLRGAADLDSPELQNGVRP